MTSDQRKVLFLLLVGNRFAAADWTAQTGAVTRELGELGATPTTMAGCANFLGFTDCSTVTCVVEAITNHGGTPYACCCKLPEDEAGKESKDKKAAWAASVAAAKAHQWALDKAKLTGATPPTLAPIVAPALTVTSPPVSVGCVTMTGKACLFTYNFSCPGQALGRFGEAADDNTIGYQCCCVEEMWKYMTRPEGGQGGAAGSVETVSAWQAIGQYQAQNHIVPPVTTTRAPPDNVQFEGIPKAVKLKFKLMQWFENMAQCPLDLNGEFPAWVGWKAVTSAAPAISTPNKGTAGQRTVTIQEFCPSHDSSEFTCVKTDFELKARSISGRMKMNMEGVTCSLQDISLYCMNDGFVGVRFDFAKCAGAVSLSGRKNHIPSTASLLMGVSQEAPSVTQTKESTGFSEFFQEVCQPSRNGTVPFLTRNLPTTLLANKNKNCFAHSGNAAHVIGKGCYEDFIFMDVQDANGGLAMIPASDLAGLRKKIPRCQSFNRPHSSRQPISVPAPPLVQRVAPTPAPPTPAPEDPCAPSAIAARKLAGVEDDPCAVPTPAPTPAPPVVEIMQEVPGVVIADRVCITLGGCSCTNERCAACIMEPPFNGEISERVFVSPPVPNITPYGVCADFWKEQFVIALVSLLILVNLLHWLEFHCILTSRCFTKIWTDDKQLGAHSSETMSLINGGGGTDHPTWSISAAPGGLAGNTEVAIQSKQHEEQSGYRIMWFNFFLHAIVTCAVVHGVWYCYELVARYVFQARWGESEWNSIAVESCKASLFGIWIALWQIIWIGMTYYYGWKKGTNTTVGIEAPFVGERETPHRDWSNWHKKLVG